MLQNFFNALFSDCGENSDRYLECTISPSEIHTGDTLVLEEHEDGSCSGRTFRVQVTGVIKDGLYDDCSSGEMTLVDSPLIVSARKTKQKAETWSISAFMIQPEIAGFIFLLLIIIHQPVFLLQLSQHIKYQNRRLYLYLWHQSNMMKHCHPLPYHQPQRHS